jgi:pimeloyl-ACP methyl ester carboxylesterase
VLLAHQRGRIDARRNVMIAPAVLVDEAVAQFGRAVALDDRDCSTLEHQIASHSGIGIEALQLERLVGERDAALLVVHDDGDREVPLRSATRLAAAWRQAQLRTTHGLGHRQILRNPQVIDEVVAFVQHGVSSPASELVREVDRLLDAQDGT